MAPTRTTARLLEAAERAGAKVVAIGDPGQLASVQAGGWLRAVGRRARRAAADRGDAPTRPRRTARARRAARPRSPTATSTGQRGPGGSTPSTTRRARASARGRRVGRRGRRGRRRAGGDDRPRQRHPPALNQAARELRRDQGQLGEQRVYGHRELAVGDRVICRRNDALLDVDNGTRGTVRHLDEHRVVIETDSRPRPRAAGAVCRRARRARLRADRSRHAGRDRRGRDRRRHTARSHSGLELHRALPRPRIHPAADPRRPARRASAPTSRTRTDARSRRRVRSCSRGRGGGCSSATTKTSRSSSSRPPGTCGRSPAHTRARPRRRTGAGARRAARRTRHASRWARRGCASSATASSSSTNNAPHSRRSQLNELDTAHARRWS